MQETVIKYLVKQYHDKRLSHAFLIETNNDERCLNDLKEFLKVISCPDVYQESCDKCNICHLIDTFQLPNLVVVRPDGQNIKKEQILELKRLFQTKPIFSRYNMYVILNAECLNASSANTMLKFLEEPEENIIGIFITNNKENMIDTIRSRCQIFGNFYQDDLLEDIPKDWIREAVSFIKEYEIVGDEAIVYVKDVLMNKISDKNDFVYLCKAILDIYYAMYLNKISFKPLKEEYEKLNFVLKKDIDYFKKQLKYVEKTLDIVQYNVNSQLLLERFVLESRD